ncbi:MAG: class I SAM-dependent methyltransferase [Methyloligellaceae bacterium]
MDADATDALTQHWDRVYQTKDETNVSWYQPRLETSLSLIKSVAPETSSAIIDVGGGSSTLVDSLIEAGYADLTVLDISDPALRLSRHRLAQKAQKVDWIVGDVTTWRPGRRYDLWHDRAVFHFLTEPERQDAYLEVLDRALGPGGHVVIATFALDGPEQCSGLPIERYSAQTMALRFGPMFELVASESELHETPTGARQSFVYTVLARR